MAAQDHARWPPAKPRGSSTAPSGGPQVEVRRSQEQSIPQKSDLAGSSSRQAAVRSDGMVQILQECVHYIGRNRAGSSDSQGTILVRARSISEFRVAQGNLGSSPTIECFQGVHRKHANPGQIGTGNPISSPRNAPVPSAAPVSRTKRYTTQRLRVRFASLFRTTSSTSSWRRNDSRSVASVCMSPPIPPSSRSN